MTEHPFLEVFVPSHTECLKQRFIRDEVVRQDIKGLVVKVWCNDSQLSVFRLEFTFDSIQDLLKKNGNSHEAKIQGVFS